MPRTLQVFRVDAFTDTPGGGNPAAVALDAGWLAPAAMQSIASRHHAGDWAFALQPAMVDADLDVRFFSPRRELPFVGHATLALHAVLARSAPRTLRRQRSSGGLVEVTSLPDGSFSIRLPAPPLGRLLEASALRDVLALLGLAPERLDARCPARVAGHSSTRLLLGLADTRALDELAPRLPELAALSQRLGVQGFFAFVLGGDAGPVSTEARMFCPAIGIDEDPVSGNAHAMLGVYLHALGLLPVNADVGEFTGRQGRHVGRPGAVGVRLEQDAAGAPSAVSIAGRAVVVGEERLTPA
jgi:PhzF family phenazine biosynthesis protein